jgi:hypothetical protein
MRVVVLQMSDFTEREVLVVADDGITPFFAAL